MTISSPPVPPPPGAPPGSTPPPAKKGLSPLAWVGIGCGVILVICLIAMGSCFFFVKQKAAEFEKNPAIAAAKLAVQLNPELELVSADEEKNTITIKNKKTGEVVTISAEDAEKGRWSFKTDKGETATFGTGAGGVQNLPPWMPAYPGGTVQGSYDVTNAEGRTVAFTVTTSDSISKVLDFYKDQLESAGLKVDKTTFSTNDQSSGGTLSAKSEDGKREAVVVVSAATGGTQAVVTMQDKK